MIRSVDLIGPIINIKLLDETNRFFNLVTFPDAIHSTEGVKDMVKEETKQKETEATLSTTFDHFVHCVRFK